MIKHIVLAKLKNPTEENISSLCSLMLSMKENIDVIDDVKVQRNILQTRECESFSVNVKE